MKVLAITYLPRGQRSRTKQLADHALALLKSAKADIEQLDIASDMPDLFTPERISVYYRRNYGGERVEGPEASLMAGMDRMLKQLKAADIVVLAYPMYNFSQPAAVKAWFDAVLQKGETWDLASGGYVGLMKGKKALIINSSGGVYEGALAGYEHSVSLSTLHFGFMGYQAEAVTAAGLNQFPEREAEILAGAKRNIALVLERWKITAQRF